MSNDPVDLVLKRVNARIPASVTPATRIEIHPAEWITLHVEIERLRAAIDNRDKDWILAMGHALGLDSGYNVPIVPEVAPFRELFAAIQTRQHIRTAGQIKDGERAAGETEARPLAELWKIVEENRAGTYNGTAALCLVQNHRLAEKTKGCDCPKPGTSNSTVSPFCPVHVPPRGKTADEFPRLAETTPDDASHTLCPHGKWRNEPCFLCSENGRAE